VPRLAGLLGAVLTLAAAGCGGTEGVGAGASDIVPASVPAFVAVDTDPASSQWKTVDALASRFPDKQKGVSALKRDLREEEGIDWEKDVKPALGKELDLAWLDFRRSGKNFVLLMQPKDEAKLKQLIAKGNEKQPSEKLLYEKFRGWYVLAEERSVIDRFEDESESASSTLAQESAFQDSMDRLGGDAIARAYVSGKVLIDLARRYGGREIRPFLEKAGTLDWIAARLGATSHGVGFDAIVHGTPGSLFKGLPRTKPFSPKLTKIVPQNALVYWTFHGSKNMFSGLEKNALFTTPGFRQFARIFRQLAKVLQGENALYLRPGAGRAADARFDIPEVTLVAAPGEGVDGAAVLDRLLTRELELAPDRTTIAGTPVRKLAAGGIGLYYANVDGKFVATDLPAGIRGLRSGGKSLADSDTYREAADASGLPGKTHEFVYVDIHSTIPLVEKLAQERIPTEIRRNLKPLQSAVEYAVSRSHELQVTVFLRIK
jgi:hypothetical protein